MEVEAIAGRITSPLSKRGLTAGRLTPARRVIRPPLRSRHGAAS